MVGHTHTVRCLQSDHNRVISGSYDHTLKIWDIATWQLHTHTEVRGGSVAESSELLCMGSLVPGVILLCCVKVSNT